MNTSYRLPDRLANCFYEGLQISYEINSQQHRPDSIAPWLSFAYHTQETTTRSYRTIVLIHQQAQDDR